MNQNRISRRLQQVLNLSAPTTIAPLFGFCFNFFHLVIWQNFNPFNHFIFIFIFVFPNNCYLIFPHAKHSYISQGSTYTCLCRSILTISTQCPNPKPQIASVLYLQMASNKPGKDRSTFVYVDAYALFENILQNYTTYGNLLEFQKKKCRSVKMHPIV